MSDEQYPAGNDYEVMYKKYFTRSPLDLINLVEINPEDNIADLCSGTGRLAKELLKFNCFVTCVDISTKMMPPEIQACFFNIQMGVDTFLQWCQEKYHGMFCQQAVNYWLNAVTAKWLAKRIVTGGFFVFNTFRECPPTYPMAKEYEIGDRKYVEVVYHVDGIVHHVQCCEGYAPHVTKFAYISPKQFREWLEPYFKLEEHARGKTAIWKAVRL
jgi:SAM-dependent methyltransferase